MPHLAARRETVPTERAAPEPASPGGGRRRFLGGCLAGALLAAVPFIWMLGAGRLELTQRHPLGAFYDTQAASLLDLHWDVPTGSLGVEAFVVGGKSYQYQGPFPALLRLPVVAVTDRFDGRLTQLSMLAAFAVTMVFVSRLSWQVRRLLGPGGPVTPGEAVAAGGFILLLGTGSSLMFLAGQAYIFHEAILWGVAWALAAYDSLVRHLSERSPRALALAGVFASLALLTRASVGLGPVMALAAVVGLRSFMALRARRRPDWRELLGPAAACLLPLVLYAYVNHAKFGTLFSVPVSAQVASRTDPARADFLRENGDSFFGLRYLPTTALQYLRPDALTFERQFPFVDFPPLAESVGEVRFDRIDRASSVPATMGWMVLLGVIGVTAVVRRRAGRTRTAAAALGPPLAGALLGSAVILPYGYIAQRYLADFIPLLVVSSLAGLHHVSSRVRSGAPGAGVLAAALVLVALAGVYVNFALGLRYQRQYGFVPERVRAELIAWQLDVDGMLPGDQAPRLRSIATARALPRSAEEGDLVAVGRCAGLYQFDGDIWRPVERTNATGRFRLALRLTDPAPNARYELVGGGSGGDRRSLSVAPGPNGRVAFVFTSTGSRVVVGNAYKIDPDEPFVFEVVMDRRLNQLSVVSDGRTLLGSLYAARDDRLQVATLIPGDLVNRPLATPVCDELVGRR